MFARAKRDTAPADQEGAQRRSSPAEPQPASTFARNKPCPCGGGCPRCARDKPAPHPVVDRMERAFGTSFADVDLRTDTEAGSRARSLGARAYTDGTEIGFAPDVFRPDTPDGLFTIAHEFAHVVQGRGGKPGARPAPPTFQLGSVHLQTEAAAQTETSSDPIEQNADAAALQALEGSLPDVKPFALDSSSPAKQDQKKGSAVVVPRGSFMVGKTTEGGYYFVFNSQDVRLWTNSTIDFYARFIRHIYPSATSEDTLAAAQSLQIAWTTPLDPLVLESIPVARFDITAQLNQGTRAWFQSNRPALAPVSSTPGKYNLDQKPGAAPSAAPANTVQTTASSTGAESQGLLKVEQLYDYLFKNFPNHPMFKERGARLEDLIQYIAKQGDSNAPKITSLDQLPPGYFKKFLDQWAEGKTVKPTTGGAPSGVEGGVEGGIHKFDPDAKLAIYPKVDKYVSGAEMRAVVEFKNSDFDNASINVFPGRALFEWSIRDSNGKVIDSGPLLFSRGEISYSFTVPPPGAYSIHVRVTSEHFITPSFSPPDIAFTSETEQKRYREVFESTLVGAGPNQPFERVDGTLKLKQNAPPAATIEGEADNLQKMLEQLSDMEAKKEITPDQASDYRKVINERLKLFQSKKGLLTGSRAYRVFGVLLDRETSESVQLQFVARGGVEEEDDKKIYKMQILDVTSSSEEPPLYSGKSKLLDDTEHARLVAEAEAFSEAAESLRAQNSYPNGTIRLTAEMSDGTLQNQTLDTANARKKVKKALGVTAMVGGGIALVVSPFTGEASAPAGVALIEGGSALGALVTISGAAAGAAALGDIGLRIEQRTRTGTMHADRTTAIDTMVAVTTIAGFGGIAKLARVAPVLNDGRLFIATTALGVGQGVLMSVDCQQALIKIEASYALQMNGKSDDERARLLQQRDQEESQVIAGFALNGGFLIIATAHGVSEITTHGFMPGPRGEPPIDYVVSERVKTVAENRNPVEIRENLEENRTLSNQERAYLQEALSRASTDPAPEPVAGPEPLPKAESATDGKSGVVDPSAHATQEPAVKPEPLPRAESPASGKGGSAEPPAHATPEPSAHAAPEPEWIDDTGIVAHGFNQIEARTAYEKWVNDDLTREVGLYFDPGSGEYIVAQGSPTEVGIAHIWKDGMGRPWVILEHYHPGSDPFARLASAQDFQAMMHWQKTGFQPEAPISTKIRWVDPDPAVKAPSSTEIGFRPGRSDGYYIKFKELNGTSSEVTFHDEPWSENSDYKQWMRKRGVPDEPAATSSQAAPSKSNVHAPADPAPSATSAPAPLPDAEAPKSKPPSSPARTAAPEITGKLRADIEATQKLTGMKKVLDRLDHNNMSLTNLFDTPRQYLEFMQRDMTTAVDRLNERISVRETQAKESTSPGAKTSGQMDFAHYTAEAEANLTREEALGKTPNRDSDTGKEVIARTAALNRISADGLSYYFPQTGKWYPIAEADMGHLHDAVVWWNKEGYLYGTRSKTVIEWMKDSRNYELQPKEFNRSQGAILGSDMQAQGLGYRRAHPEPIPSNLIPPAQP